MTTTLAESSEVMSVPWWVVLLEGIAAVIIGILLLTAPGIPMFALIQIIGFFWLLSGIFRIVSIFVESSLWGWKLLAGIVGVLAGLVVLQHPVWSSLLLPAVYVVILGVQGIILGGAGLVMAFRGGGWGTGVLGVLSIILGLVLLVNPLFIGIAVLPFVLGAFALLGGILAIVAAFMMRKGSAETREASSV